jgi:hypothetical protein
MSAHQDRLRAEERRAEFWLAWEARWQAIVAWVVRVLDLKPGELMRFAYWLYLLFLAATVAFYIRGLAAMLAR